MSTREELARQRRLSTSEMDEVIERAARLQARAGEKPGHSLADIKKVGAELDIDARWVDQAEAELRAERAAAERAKVEQRALLKKVAAGAGAALGALLLVGWMGGSGIRSAAAEADLARGNLDTVLRRQASLVPQLVALSGGDVTAMGGLQQQVESARDIEARTRAADELQLVMAQALGKLPAATDPSQAQQRLSLQHELVGSTNRITTERRRYEEAMARWRASAAGPLGHLSTGLGLAPSPPPP